MASSPRMPAGIHSAMMFTNFESRSLARIATGRARRVKVMANMMASTARMWPDAGGVPVLVASRTIEATLSFGGEVSDGQQRHEDDHAGEDDLVRGDEHGGKECDGGDQQRGELFARAHGVQRQSDE